MKKYQITAILFNRATREYTSWGYSLYDYEGLGENVLDVALDDLTFEAKAEGYEIGMWKLTKTEDEGFDINSWVDSHLDEAKEKFFG